MGVIRLYGILIISFLISGQSLAGFPVSVNAGRELGQSTENAAIVTLSATPAKVIASERHVLRLGYLYLEDATMDGFLAGAGPIRPFNVSQYWNHAVIITNNPSVTLAWSDVSSGAPITYRLRYGESPEALANSEELTETSFQAGPLKYLTWYYWQVDAIDAFGRLSESDMYSFSLAPQIFKGYCAPNPAPTGRTSFVFDMPGPGSANVAVYSLPHMSPVFETSLNGLGGGTNVYMFDGRDNQGRQLFNGTYMVKINCFGGRGENSNRFKLLVVR